MKLESDLKMRWTGMMRARDPWLNIWQELAEVFTPGKAHFTVRPVQGERDNEKVYDSTPRRAARKLAASIDGLIKPKTANWFEPTIDDEDLLRNWDVKNWLEYVQDRMWRAIYRTEARFIQRSAEVDSNLVVHGWGVLWIAENAPRNGLQFKSFHNAKVSFEENGDGQIDCLAFEECLTARQAAAKFGESALHTKVKECLYSVEPAKVRQEFQFGQLVLPNYDRLGQKLGFRSMPFATVVMDMENEHIISRGGFHEFPAAVPRWDTEAGQNYPRSPGMIALPDALTLQAISRTLLIGGERAADPPLMVPSDAFLSPVRTFPGGLSVFDVQALADGNLSTPVFPLPTSNTLPVGREMQADYRFQVEAAFYNNVLSIGASGVQQTATEVLERKEEFIRELGPIFGRLEADYVGMIVNRVFAIMERHNAFPPRPQALLNVPITFKYQSPLQQARKAIDIAGLNRTIEVTAPLQLTQPGMLDWIDGDQIMMDSPEWSGIPTDWLRSEDEIAEIRQGRAEQEEAQAEIDNAQPVADSLKAVAQAQEISANVPPETI